jgi:hypothetical protein
MPSVLRLILLLKASNEYSLQRKRSVKVKSQFTFMWNNWSLVSLVNVVTRLRLTIRGSSAKRSDQALGST